MATPTPRHPSRHPPATSSSLPEVVDPRWLLKALAAAIAGAAILAYLSVCLLIYQGGWQRLLFPSTKIDQTPASVGLDFQPIRFDASSDGRPRLAGWWIPSASPVTPSSLVILFLHDGTGSLSTPVRTFALLHRANLSVFAFDYRGFGQSEPPHPSEARMTEDASAALDYLVNTRHIPLSSILPYGQGLGAVLAANLVNIHPELPALILDTPDPNAFQRATSDTQFRWLPTRLLVREHFDLATPLAHSTKPKLLFTNSPNGSTNNQVKTNQIFFRSVPDPRMTVTFDSVTSEDAYLESLHRFLDQYLHP